MTTSIASKTVTVDPWQLQVLKGDNALKIVTKEEVAVIEPANDADDLFAGRQHQQFLPRFLPAPDGMEWS